MFDFDKLWRSLDGHFAPEVLAECRRVASGRRPLPCRDDTYGRNGLVRAARHEGDVIEGELIERRFAL